MELGGAMAAGAAMGAAVGGGVFSAPAAAGGAAMGVVVVTTSKFVDALVTTRLGFSGPSDNWNFNETGDCNGQTVCFGTYNESDTWYVKTYWNEYKGSNERWVMSAGQAKDGLFQLCVWNQHQQAIHTVKCYHRDYVHVCFKDGKWRMMHAKGELWGEEGGKVDVYSR